MRQSELKFYLEICSSSSTKDVMSSPDENNLKVTIL